MTKKFVFALFTIFLFAGCSKKIIVQQKDVDLKLEISTSKNFTLEEFRNLNCLGRLINKSGTSFYIPRLLEDSRPLFLSWSLVKKGGQPLGSAAPDIDTYGYGLEYRYIQLVEDTAEVTFSFNINLEKEFKQRNMTLEPGTYYLKLSLENFYYNAKNQIYPMWFGHVESNEQVIVVR